MTSDLHFGVSPSANEAETAAIVAALTLMFANIKQGVDNVEDKSNSWVTKHRELARISTR